MEKKLLKLLKLADELDCCNGNVFAEIIYTAKSRRKLAITIKSKKNNEELEEHDLYLTENKLDKVDNLIRLFESYIKLFKAN